MRVKIISTSYLETEMESRADYVKLLAVACDGGGGHNLGMEAALKYLQQLYLNKIIIPTYDPKLFINDKGSWLKTVMYQSSTVIYSPVIGTPIRNLLHHTPIPILPSQKDIDDEVQQKRLKFKVRPYMNMLALCPGGEESAAAWDLSQRQDNTHELNKLVNLQAGTDWFNYQPVYEFYFETLKRADLEGQPFTGVLCTQAMALAALCNAVKDYNIWALDRDSKSLPITIRQYMTDLPQGARHFLYPLAQLKKEEQEQMVLYGVGITNDIIKEYFKVEPNFAAICSIPFDDNPLIRPGFKDSALNNCHKFSENITLVVSGSTENETISYPIYAGERCAAIMLGSQAGNDTFDYIETLITLGMDKIFVFGAKTNPLLDTKINQLIQEHPHYRNQIIALSNQNDRNIVAIMTRAQVLIIRGGGLSVMEQMAMEHHPEQLLFFHHHSQPEKELSSGIIWEDENVRALMCFLKNRGIYSQKTSPAQFGRDLIEAQIITALGDTPKDLAKLSFKTLRYLKFLTENKAFVRERFIDLENALEQHIFPLDQLLTSLLEKRASLENRRNLTLPKLVFQHKWCALYQAILSLETFMFPKHMDQNLEDVRKAYFALKHTFEKNYLYVQLIGDGYSETETLVRRVSKELRHFIQKNSPNSLMETSKITFFSKRSVPMELTPIEEQLLITALKQLMNNATALPTNPRIRVKLQLLTTAEKFLNTPYLNVFNELTHLNHVFLELNQYAYHMMNENVELVDKIIQLGKQALNQNDEWEHVKNPSIPHEPESDGFCMVAELSPSC